MGLLKGNNAPYDTFLFRSAARPFYVNFTPIKNGRKVERIALHW